MGDSGEEGGPNLRSGRYIIVESKLACERCNKVTAVFAIALPAGYESLVAGEGDDSDSWEASPISAVLSYVEYLPETVASRISALTSRFKRPDGDTGKTFWMNHCEHCGAAIEEEELHGDLDGPFGPLPPLGLEAIQLHPVREAFEGWAGGESHDVKPLDS